MVTQKLTGPKSQLGATVLLRMSEKQAQAGIKPDSRVHTELLKEATRIQATLPALHPGSHIPRYLPIRQEKPLVIHCAWNMEVG